MKKLLTLLLITYTSLVFGQGVVVRTGPVASNPAAGNYNKQAVQDANLKVLLTLGIPYGTSFTLNNATSEVGKLFYNTTIDRVGIYNGTSWDTLSVGNQDLVNYYTKTQSDARYLLSGNYANPTWLTSLTWSKITNTPTTLAGYGITDAVHTSRILTINGVPYDLSANRSWTIDGVTSVGATAGVGISVSGVPITSTGSISITNTAPDQTVVLTNGTGISVTGTYPGFTITNTNPSPAGLTDSLAKKANRTFDNVASGAIAQAKVSSLISDLALKANLASPTFTGTVETPLIKITSGASNGKVLTSDASGVASWQTLASAYKGTWNASTNTPTIADGTGALGDYYVISAGGTQFGRTYVTGGQAIYNGSIWQNVGTASGVTSVNGYTGVVSLVKSDLSLGNVDNTSDVNKPVSTAQQTALNLKANLASPTFTGTVTAPTFVGNLTGNASTVTTNANLTGVVTSVGNATSIADNALSITKTSGLQSALNLKANLASPGLTGVPTAPTATAGTNTTQLATTAFVTTAVAAGGGGGGGGGAYLPLAGGTLTGGLNGTSANFTANVADTYAATIINQSYTGFGLLIQNWADAFPAFRIKNAAGTAFPIEMYGDGSIFAISGTFAGKGEFGESSGTALRLNRVTSGDNVDINFYNTVTTAGDVARIRMYADGGNNARGGLSFSTTQTPNTLLERLTISSAGNFDFKTGTVLIGNNLSVTTGAIALTPTTFLVGSATANDNQAITLQAANSNYYLRFKNAAGTILGGIYSAGTGIILDPSSVTLYGALIGTSGTFSANLSALNLSGTNTGDQTNITGNAGTATRLQTARTIAGVSFDGTANISLNTNAITNGAGYITAASLSGYLPLTGGTLTGALFGTAATWSGTLTANGLAYFAYDIGFTSNAGYGITSQNGTRQIAITNAGITVSQAANFSSTVTAVGGFFNSDERWKDFNDKTFDLSALQGRSFRWNQFSGKDDGKNHFGYKAQDVQKYMPDAVSANEKGYLSVNYIEVLVAKVQKLEQEVKLLKAGGHN